jgi:hypothetical protein
MGYVNSVDIPAGHTKAAPQGLGRWGTPLAVGVCLVLVAWIGYALALQVGNPSVGLDYRWHMDASQRLLDTGSPYWPWQVAAPYVIGNGAILYPPTAFLLFVPFLWLPAVLWWAIPMGLTVYCMARHRPSLVAWAVILGLVAWPNTLNTYLFGNPGMWMTAFLAAGTVWGWPVVLLALKPSFVPFAIIGIRKRSWWVAAVALGLVSLVFGQLWLEWLTVLRNATDGSLLYNLPSLPTMLLPIVAWLGATSAQARPARR